MAIEDKDNNITIAEKWLLDGIKVHLHGLSGEPRRGMLFWKGQVEQPLHQSLVWKSSSYFSETKELQASDMTILHRGCQTRNFLHSVKYTHEELLPDLDERCFSVCSEECSMDIELADANACNQVLNFIKDRTQLSETDVTQENCEQPTGISQLCYSITKSTRFSNFILFCILLNTFVMALQSPVESNADFLDALSYIDRTMLVVFTLELIIKVLAMEGIRPLLHDHWDTFDLIIVLSSWISEFPFFHLSFNISAFRSFRAMRALKYLTGVQEILETFTGTMKMVFYALVCYTYFLSLFAVAATHAFGDALVNRCVISGSDSTVEEIEPLMFCNPSDPSCGSGSVCSDVGNPDFGYTGFSSFGMSFLTLYKVSSRAGLIHPLNGTMQTRSALSVIFFVAVLVFVSFMVLALFVAIVRASFGSMKDKRMRCQEEYEKKQNAYKAKNRPVCRKSSVFGIQRLDTSRLRTNASLWVAGATASEKEGSKVMHVFPRDGKLVVKCSELCASWSFELFISACILINTVLLAMEYYGMPQAFKDLLLIAEHFFTLIFTVEMLIKILGLKGIYAYLVTDEHSAWNKFDCVIVVGAAVDFVLSLMGKLDSGGASVSLLRAVRLLRIVRILRSNKELLSVLRAIINSLTAMLNLLLFMLLVNIVFAILGMQLYGGILPEDTRSSFDSFFESLLTLFRIFSGGGTWGIFYEALESPAGITAPFFFLAFIVFSVYVTLNFMIVILLSSFNPSEEEIQKGRSAQLEYHASVVASTSHPIHTINRSLIGDKDMYNLVRKARRASVHLSRDKLVKMKGVRDLNTLQQCKQNRSSLFLFKPHSKFREATTKAVSQLNYFIIFCIALSSLGLALESPRISEELKLILSTADMVFLGIFYVEFILKIISLGFIFGKKAYIRDPWNKLDFAVLFLSTMGYIAPSSGIGGYFRIGRILRPLRVVSRNEGMKVIIRSISKSFHEVAYALVLIFCMFFMFGVLGTNLFSGKFYFCNDSSVGFKSECVGFFQDVNQRNITIPRVWKNPYHHFDHIGAALVALFEVVTGKGWTAVMFSGMDVTDIDIQPRRNHSSYLAIYFVLFVFIGTFYMLKIFVGIIVSNFRRFNGSALLTTEQLLWKSIKKRIAEMSPVKKPQTTGWQLEVYNVVMHSRFDILITIVVYVNAICLASMVPELMSVCHWICVAIYAAETFLKIVAFGPTLYFLGPWWNRSEFCILLGMTFLPLFSTDLAYTVALTRAFEFRRIKLAFQRMNGINILLQTIVDSALPIFQITSLFLLVLFIYAIMGMHLFGQTKWGHGLNVNMSFTTFEQSLLSLLRFASGDNWADVLHSCRITLPYCSKRISSIGEDVSDCGFPFGATVYFYSFFVFVFLVFLNLYVAAILDTYVSTTAANDDGSDCGNGAFSESDCLNFKTQWERFDVNGDGFIPNKDFREFLLGLGAPIGISSQEKPYRQEMQLNHLLMECAFIHERYLSIAKRQENISVSSEKKLFFNDVLLAVVRRRFSDEYFTPEERLSILFLRASVKLKYSREIASSMLKCYVKKWRLKKSKSASAQCDAPTLPPPAPTTDLPSSSDA